jgi:hypothetical protein
MTKVWRTVLENKYNWNPILIRASAVATDEQSCFDRNEWYDKRPLVQGAIIINVVEFRLLLALTVSQYRAFIGTQFN